MESVKRNWIFGGIFSQTKERFVLRTYRPIDAKKYTSPFLVVPESDICPGPIIGGQSLVIVKRDPKVAFRSRNGEP